MQIVESKPIKANFNIAIVVSRFNEEVTHKLYQGAINRLKEIKFPEQHITVAWVPGAVEIPLIAQRFAKTNAYAAVICLGAVIRGETNHYDYVCNQVSDGCQRVALDNEIPIIFGVLTTENEEQALARAGGSHSDVGKESVDTALDMISVLQQIG